MRRLLPVVALLASSPAFAADPAFTWSQVLQVKGSGFEPKPNSVALDAGGHSYVAGQYQSPFTLGGLEGPEEAKTTGVFVTRLGTDGKPEWLRTFNIADAGVPYTGERHSVAVVPGGGFVLAGQFEHSVTFDGTALSANVPGTAGGYTYLAKFTDAGKAEWAVTHPNAGGGAWRGVAVTADGGYVVAGQVIDDPCKGTVDLNCNKSLVSVARYDGQGKPVWGAHVASQLAVAISADGHICTTGIHTPTSQMDGGKPLAKAGFHVARFTADGKLEWARTIEGSLSNSSIAADSDGSCVLGATTSGGQAIVDGTTVKSFSSSATDGLIARWDATGKLAWVLQIGGKQQDGVGPLAIDAGGNVLVAGLTKGPGTFGTLALGGSKGSLFVGRVDRAGKATGLKEDPSALTAPVTGAGVGSDGSLTIAGILGGKADFDGHAIENTNAMGSAGYVAHLAAFGAGSGTPATTDATSGTDSASASDATGTKASSTSSSKSDGGCRASQEGRPIGLLAWSIVLAIVWRQRRRNGQFHTHV